MQRFADEFADNTVRLGAWRVEPDREDLIACHATLTYADRIVSLHARATGPIGAMTSMLYEIGVPVQIVSLHQREIDGQITVFLLCERDDRQCWSCGNGRSSDEASVNALIAAANRLLSR